MAFDSLSEFFAMGGHGFYVWMAYISGVIVIAWHVFLPRWEAKQVRRRIARQIKLEEQLDANESGS